jgi:photolyase PhrII
MTESTFSPHLPRHLKERVSALKDRPLDRRKPYVLYWMHHAIRDHENPALDTALAVGNRVKRPVLVYQGLGGRHPYNADRHHMFIMEGAREIQQGLRQRDIAYRFHLPLDPEHRGPLRALAREAVLVITETFPAPPFPRWTAALAASIDTPVWTVDCSCTVPMATIGRSFARAFQFRKHTQPAFDARLKHDWNDLEPEVTMLSDALPVENLDLQGADLQALCARCRIDHGIGPVYHTPGGSRAGYARWKAFKTHGLRAYVRLRNDAALKPPRGVSRLSPYLHYGMVSPFRIAREAAADGSAGAAKFLDELLVWRELAYNFCFHTPDPETLQCLPDWARESLLRHAGDPRSALYDPEVLERARTGEVLWDLAQRSLLRHGELHNNLRMTWGKALVTWTRSPEEALKRLIDLNHRLALDGCDPNSYGGILWCLGLFDRPFQPEQPVIGALRARPLEGHARRLDIAAYRKKVEPPAAGPPLSIAVVGAGLSGLRAAAVLADHGHRVIVFEKDPRPGGRLGGFPKKGSAVDAGAQYFTVRDARFGRQVAAWTASGLVAPWKGRLGAVDAPGRMRDAGGSIQRHVARPYMARLAEHLSEGLDLRCRRTITRLHTRDGRWSLEDARGGLSETWDVVILATPPRQAAALLPARSVLAEKLAEVHMAPCWAVLAVFDRPLDLPFDGLFFNDGPLSWAARNNSKPERPGEETWVLHAARGWRENSTDVTSKAIGAELLAAFFDYTALGPMRVHSLQTRHWKAAAAVSPLNEGCLWNRSEGIGVCGDWCARSRIEGAFLSGTAAAGRVLTDAPRLAAGRDGKK